MKLQLLQMCICVCFSFSLSSHLYLNSHLSLSVHVCLSLFMSLFSCLSLPLFHVCFSLFSMHCMLCVVVCVVCVECWAVRVVVRLWMCVRFFLSGTKKRSCVYVQNARSKRSRVNGQNAPVCTGHGRFERTHSRVFPSFLVSPSLLSSLLFSSLSPLMRHSFSPSLSSRLSLSLVGSLSVLNNKDNDRSSSWLSLYTRPYLALRARVRRP